jgi:hypothetical protein
MKAHKFSDQILPNSTPYTYPNIWSIETTTGPDRLVIAPSSDQVGLMIELANTLPEPFGILYVLLVSRCDNTEGRYQAPYQCDREEMESFLKQFRDYFELDGRHHIWVTSLPASATLVYDNHNVIYAYGPLEEYKRILSRRGLRKDSVRFPVPHTHNYNAEFDDEEKRILGFWEWQRFPLMQEDDR